MLTAPKHTRTRTRRGRLSRTVAVGVAAALPVTLIPSTAYAHGSQIEMEYSSSASRASARPLNGAMITGSLFATIPSDPSIAAVEFYLDDTDLAGSPRRIDRAAPFDFVGGTSTSATAFDTRALASGSHTITALITHTDADVTIVETTFDAIGTRALPGITSATGVAAVTVADDESRTIRIDSGQTVSEPSLPGWGPDSGFTGGFASSRPLVTAIAGTTDDAVYRTERSATANLAGFSYSFPASVAGEYIVTLKFAEIYFGATGGGAGGAGKRVFSANIEDGPVELADFDIYQSVGSMTAVDRTFVVPVTDGALDIRFTAKVNRPTVSAITVVAPLPAIEPPPTPIATNWANLRWATAAPSMVGRAEAQGAVVGGKLYVFGGFVSGWTGTKRSEVFDPATNSWSRLPDFPVYLSHSPAVADGKNIWLIGGYGGLGTTRVWKYDTVARTYTAGPALPAGRGAGAAAIVGRELHFFGGSTFKSDPDRSEHWALNLDSGTRWVVRAPMPNPRNHVTAVALNGQIYAIGGQYRRDESTGLQDDVDRFDPATNTWTAVANLPKARSHIVSVVFGGQILVLGGTNPGNTASRDVTAYDPVTNTWTLATSLPTGRKTGVAGVIGDAIIFNGGGFATSTYVGKLL